MFRVMPVNELLIRSYIFPYYKRFNRFDNFNTTSDLYLKY